MAVTAGVVACTGVATTALIIRRDSSDPLSTSSSEPSGSEAGASTTFVPGGNETTTSVVGSLPVTIDSSMVWDALRNAQDDPSGAGLIDPKIVVHRDQMPTPEIFGCATPECGAMFNYIVWHEIANLLGYGDVHTLEAVNPTIDFSQPPREGDVLQSVHSADPVPTTAAISVPAILLIDGGAPDGAMDDALRRLSGYNPQLAPPIDRTFAQSMVMPTEDHDSIAQSAGSLVGIGGFDTWDPSLFPGSLGGFAAAVVIGADYWSRVQNAPTPTTLSPPTTSIG